jgi:hypothetical protein
MMNDEQSFSIQNDSTYGIRCISLGNHLEQKGVERIHRTTEKTLRKLRDLTTAITECHSAVLRRVRRGFFLAKSAAYTPADNARSS